MSLELSTWGFLIVQVEGHTYTTHCTYVTTNITPSRAGRAYDSIYRQKNAEGVFWMLTEFVNIEPAPFTARL